MYCSNVYVIIVLNSLLDSNAPISQLNLCMFLTVLMLTAESVSGKPALTTEVLVNLS